MVARLYGSWTSPITSDPSDLIVADAIPGFRIKESEGASLALNDQGDRLRFANQRHHQRGD